MFDFPTSDPAVIALHVFLIAVFTFVLYALPLTVRWLWRKRPTVSGRVWGWLLVFLAVATFGTGFGLWCENKYPIVPTRRVGEEDETWVLRKADYKREVDEYKPGLPTHVTLPTILLSVPLFVLGCVLIRDSH